MGEMFLRPFICFLWHTPQSFCSTSSWVNALLGMLRASLVLIGELDKILHSLRLGNSLTDQTNLNLPHVLPSKQITLLLTPMTQKSEKCKSCSNIIFDDVKFRADLISLNLILNA